MSCMKETKKPNAVDDNFIMSTPDMEVLWSNKI